MASATKTTIIGLKNIHYAIMDSDTTSAATYQTPKKIGHAVSIDIQPQNQESKLYGDNMLIDNYNNISEYNITIETTDLPLEDKAALLGHTYTSDTMSVTATDIAPNVAILFEAEMRNGDIRAMKFYKGRFAPSQETINTRGENQEYQVPKLEGVFKARIFDGKIKDEKDFAKGADTSTWYASV